MNKGDGKKPLEIEAKWAPMDWEQPKPTPEEQARKPRVQRWLEERLDPKNWLEEEERIPWRARFRKLPKAALEAVPLTLTLYALYVFAMGIENTIAPLKPLAVERLVDPVFIASWVGIFSLLLGWQTASYQPGILRPTLKAVAQHLWHNRYFIIGLGLFLFFIDFSDNTESSETATHTINTIMVLVILFGVVDLKAYKPRRSQDRADQQ